MRRQLLPAGWILSLAAAFPLSAWAAEPTPLPVKRVVMFSSGVAFYERTGDVQGDATLDLKFNARDVNDLLKSMVLQDFDGGKVSAVSYSSKDPLTRTLKTFSIDLTANPTLADLLGQLRGEKIEIDAPTAIVGSIVGIEYRQKPVGERETVQVPVVNLLTEDGLRSVSLENVGRIKLSDPKLNDELKQALKIIALGHDNEKKSVTLKFAGEGKRGVRVGYIQESPIWKTSYRLVLSDDKPLLQGWAIVENTTEEDWNEVNLTLVSGRPISFVMDLYQPLYLARPEVKPELYASLRPRTYEQDLAAANLEFAAAANAAPARRERDAAKKQSGDGLARGAQQEEQLKRFVDAKGEGGFGRTELGRSISSAAQASDVGEMFQYKIAVPVKLARQGSAMLPIVNESVQADRVSIYNAAVHAKHPLNGLRLKNTTELHLMQGPVTVFDDGAYAGDAQIQDISAGSERLISYAMDLDTEVAPTSHGKPDLLVTAKLVRGTLQVTRKFEREFKWTVKNSGKKAKKVLLEHPLDPNWTLVEPKEAAEKTRGQYRFAVDAAPGKPAEFVAREERTGREDFVVTNLDDNQIRLFTSAPQVGDKVKAALAEVVRRKQALAVLTAKRGELERQVKVIFEEQNRIRQNMGQLPKDSDLFRRYVTKFNEHEDQIDRIRTQVTAALADETKERQALDAYLQGLDL